VARTKKNDERYARCRPESLQALLETEIEYGLSNRVLHTEIRVPAGIAELMPDGVERIREAYLAKLAACWRDVIRTAFGRVLPCGSQQAEAFGGERAKACANCLAGNFA